MTLPPQWSLLPSSTKSCFVGGISPAPHHWRRYQWLLKPGVPLFATPQNLPSHPRAWSDAPGSTLPSPAAADPLSARRLHSLQDVAKGCVHEKRRIHHLRAQILGRQTLPFWEILVLVFGARRPPFCKGRTHGDSEDDHAALSLLRIIPNSEITGFPSPNSKSGHSTSILAGCCSRRRPNSRPVGGLRNEHDRA
jgi:hypothetical protein